MIAWLTPHRSSSSPRCSSVVAAPSNITRASRIGRRRTRTPASPAAAPRSPPPCADRTALPAPQIAIRTATPSRRSHFWARGRTGGAWARGWLLHGAPRPGAREGRSLPGDEQGAAEHRARAEHAPLDAAAGARARRRGPRQVPDDRRERSDDAEICQGGGRSRSLSWRSSRAKRSLLS